MEGGSLNQNSSNARLDDATIPYQKRVLLKALLRTIALASYAPTSGTAVRPEVIKLVQWMIHVDALFLLPANLSFWHALKMLKYILVSCRTKSASSCSRA